MNESHEFVILFVVAIIVHELGHLLAYRFFGVSAKFRLRWWGISVESNKEETLKQYLVIVFAGIFSGLAIVSYSDSYILFLVYVICCMVDISGIIYVNDLILTKNVSLDTKLKEIKTYVRGVLVE